MSGNIEDAKKCCKHEMSENTEEAINKLAKKLDTYDGVIDLRINNLHEDIIVYGFIKDKKHDNCKWKKFKVEKKCRSESQDFNNIQNNSRRIEENFKLDKLNQTDKADRIDRLDIIDFDEYENDIQQLSSDKNIPQVTSNGGYMEQPVLGKYPEATSNAVIWNNQFKIFHKQLRMVVTWNNQFQIKIFHKQV